MKQTIKLFSTSIKFFLPALVLFSSCFKESSNQRRASSADTYTDIKYGSNTDISGNSVDLKLDVYVPKNASAGRLFPLVLYVHGGGFVDGDKSEASGLMLKFVDSGYVAVSINYRLYDESADGTPCDADTTLTKYAAYMAVQDTKAALRYMVANAAVYRIDVSKIFLAGSSAGAVTVLNTTYLTQSNFNSIIPGAEAALGGLNNSSNNLTNTFNIRGIAANSGCLPDPSYITAANVVPMILFHGEKDKVIPVEQGRLYNCDNTQFVYGSKSIYNKAATLESAVVAHIEPSGDHLPYSQNFVFENEACFFGSILNKVPQSGYYTGTKSSCR